MTREDLLRKRQRLTLKLEKSPYSAQIYFVRASVHKSLGYSDLAAADAYKALLLIDEVKDKSGEYHQQAQDAFFAAYFPTDMEEPEDSPYIPHYVTRCYLLLIRCLMECGCLRSAHEFCAQGLRRVTDENTLKDFHDLQSEVIRQHHLYQSVSTAESESSLEPQNISEKGLARREIYPWNDHEPDRYSEDYIAGLNVQLASAAPKCVVKATELPMLSGTAEARETSELRTTQQLGLFAASDVAPNETVLSESSILTACNALHDSRCDACAAKLPPLDSTNGTEGHFACTDCEDCVFCSQTCLEKAMVSYHPAVCGQDIESVARDTDPREADDALYFLLVVRAIAMAETQDVHPLDLKEVSSLWGDFTTLTSPSQSPSPISAAALITTNDPSTTLPFSFRHHVLLPLHILTLLDMDIFAPANVQKYDTWVLNTLYAKFRAVASGRSNIRTGVPETCAVHPLWCLANHSCAPNVGWKWSGNIRLVARGGGKNEEGSGRKGGFDIVRWGPEKDIDDRWLGGIKAGQEVLSHYCDPELPVQERRAWAVGPLGGECMCERCVWESAQGESQTVSTGLGRDPT